ncbi:MAG: GldG family protein [Gammaproteobacteria bacterium]
MATGARSDVRGLWRRRLGYAGTGLAILVVTGWLLALAVEHRRGADWSSTQRHTLTAASREALKAIVGPIEVTVYLPQQHGGRERAQELVARYQRVREDIRLRFVAPADAVETMRAENLREGEMAIAIPGEHGERRELIQAYTEREFTNALARLARADEQWIVFVTGHGERSPARAANFDLSDWAKVLGKRGLKVQELNLAAQGVVPDNTRLLVLASPQLDLLPGEVAAIEAWLGRGGALLWLMEPALPPSLAPLARTLGITPLPATIVDPATTRLGIDNAAVAVVTAYDETPAVAGFSATVLLPYAVPLEAADDAGWQAARLFASGAEAWGETGTLAGSVARDDTDRAGPLSLAYALTRKMQRVIVIGDGDFLSNTWLGNGGNRDLGVRLVEWLTHNDALVDVASTPAPDTVLRLARWQTMVIAFGFLFVLPLAFAANGLWLWWRRRTA